MHDALVPVALATYAVIILAKPLWYLIPLAVARPRLGGYGPHWPVEGTSWRAAKLGGATRGEWMILLGCAALRAVLGWSILLVRYAIGGDHGGSDAWRPNEWNDVFFVWLAVLGFGFWLLVGKVAFRRAPVSKLVVFALLAEALSLLVDIPLVLESRFSIC